MIDLLPASTITDNYLAVGLAPALSESLPVRLLGLKVSRWALLAYLYSHTHTHFERIGGVTIVLIWSQ